MASSLHLISKVRGLKRLRETLRKERQKSRCTSVQTFEGYYNDPVGFCRDVLGLELWSRQAEMAQAVADHPAVAVRSGHKVGKSTGAGGVSLWWTATRPRGVVVLTSASFAQIEETLWPELCRLHKNALIPLGGDLHDTPRGGLRWADGRRIFGRSTNTAERMAGLSGAELLFVIDEASGIDESIFEAIEGNRAGGARELMLGNPTQTSGTFFDAFHSKREFYHTMHISSEESPNVVSGEMTVPGLAMRDWVEKNRRAWGKDSPKYQIRVLGDFSTQSSDSVIGLGLVEAAIARWRELEPIMPDLERDVDRGRLEIGVDVARYGDDDSVITPRRGRVAFRSDSVHGQNTVQITGRVLDVARQMRGHGERPRVRVDGIGVGAGVVDQLLEHPEVEVVEVNASESALCDEEYTNVRAETWFALRDWLKTGAIPPDAELEGELLAPRYSFDGRGRQRVEPKDDIKKRLGRSPDKADSLGLSVVKTFGMHIDTSGSGGERQSLDMGGF